MFLKKHALLGFAAAGALWLASAPASAITITSSNVGSNFQINWSLLAGQSDNDGGATSSINLSAIGSFNVVSLTTTALTLNVTMENTTVLSGGVANAGITSFGVGVSPDATSVSFSDTNDGAFSSAVLQTGQQNYPGGFKKIDVCVFTQGCSGGSQGSALAVGASDTFSLTINGPFSGGAVALDPFAIKFQTSENSFEFASVPAPAPVALIGLGLLGLGLARRARGQST